MKKPCEKFNKEYNQIVETITKDFSDMKSEKNVDFLS